MILEGMGGTQSGQGWWVPASGRDEGHPKQSRMVGTHSLKGWGGTQSGQGQWAPTSGRDAMHPDRSGMLDTPKDHRNFGALSPCHAQHTGPGFLRRAGGFSPRPPSLSLCHAEPAPAAATAPSAFPQIPRLSPCPSSPRRCRRASGSSSPAWPPPTPRSKATGEEDPGTLFGEGSPRPPGSVLGAGGWGVLNPGSALPPGGPKGG